MAGKKTDKLGYQGSCYLGAHCCNPNKQRSARFYVHQAIQEGNLCPLCVPSKGVPLACFCSAQCKLKHNADAKHEEQPPRAGLNDRLQTFVNEHGPAKRLQGRCPAGMDPEVAAMALAASVHLCDAIIRRFGTREKAISFLESLKDCPDGRGWAVSGGNAMFVCNSCTCTLGFCFYHVSSQHTSMFC
jgi:hypothetical protein